MRADPARPVARSTPTRRLWRRGVRRPGASGGSEHADPAHLAL